MNVIGFDIGGTKSAVILGKTEQDKIIFCGRTEIKTTSDWRGVLDTLCDEARLMAEANGVDIEDAARRWCSEGKATLAAGLSCGGPLSADRKTICSPPNLPGWDEVPVTAYLEQKLGIPVSMENDADACALAEWQYGAGRGYRNVIFLTFGTGLGAGLILDGRLYRGSSGMAGEVGHIKMAETGPVGYGKVGSLEGFCSGGGISRLAALYAEKQKELGRVPSFVKEYGSAITARDLAEAAKAGDPDAIEIYRISGREFGRGLSILIDLLNPDCIIAGSIYARCQDLFDQKMYEEIEKETLAQSREACRITPALLGEQIGDYGAVMAALYG